LTAEQLQAARAAHWRQNQSPILTLDEAQSWLQQHPLCLYLPRRAQLPVPAPSFVEACLGSAHATPGPAAIEQAQGLLTRLVASGAVVALNLLGTVSEQPDFLAHSEALPFILSLRADADWKHAPQKSSGHKVSPLVLELWKALDQEGTLTASVARETLGRELTEAAVLRALCELWQALRISPAFAAEGQPTGWELMRVRHREALATGSATSQVTAISLLVSMYLQSVYAASSEEIEIFLSPLASRSRVREAVRGLAATRQIHSLSMDAQTYHFIEGGLPEFAEIAPAEKREEFVAPARPEPVRRPLPAQRRDQQPLGPSAPTRSAPIFARRVARTHTRP
jgi:23S rRNA pseudouridine2605 synthase